VTTDRRLANLLLGFLAVLHLLAIIALLRRSEGIAPGVVLVSTVPVIMGGAYLLRGLFRPVSWLDLWVLIYGLWSLTSAVMYAQDGNPSEPGAFAYGLYHFLLPVACYFAARLVSREEHPRLISGLVLLNALALGYGIFLHITRPDYYRDYLIRVLTPTGAAEEWQFFARLQSYLGSTSVGYLGAVSLVLVTLAGPGVRRLLPLLVVLFITGTALSLQRASYVGMVLGLGFLVFLSNRMLFARLSVVALLVGVLGYGAARIVADPVAGRVLVRATREMTEGLEGFKEDRGYGPGLEYLRKFPLGVGLGATSSAATNAGLTSKGEVVDANFMRIAADLGLPGLALFLLVLGAAAWRAWTSRHRAAWLTFLLIHCGIMLSTNVFDSFYISHGFWLMLALIDSDHDSATEPVRQPALGTGLYRGTTAVA
jgi:hypothetical protein